MTTAMPTTLPIDPAETPLNNYLLALNALVGQLSINESSHLPNDFCQKYDLHPDFLFMLTKMGFLVEDDSGKYPAYKRTKSLLAVQPQQAQNWMINFLKGDQIEETTEQKQKVAEIEFSKPKANVVLDEEPKKVSKNPAPKAETLKSALVELINKLSFYEFREINVQRIYDTYDLDWSFFEVLLQRGFISRSKHQKSFRFKKSKGFAAKVSGSKLDEIESWFEPIVAVDQLKAATDELNALPPLTNPIQEILQEVDQQLSVTNDEIDEVTERIAESVATTTIDETKTTCAGDCGMNYCDDNGCMERDRHYVKHPVNPISPDDLTPATFAACPHYPEGQVTFCRTFGCRKETEKWLASDEIVKQFQESHRNLFKVSPRPWRFAQPCLGEGCTREAPCSNCIMTGPGSVIVEKAPEPLPTDWLLRQADGTIVVVNDRAEALDKAVSMSKDDEAVVIVYRPVFLAKPKVIKTAELTQID